MTIHNGERALPTTLYIPAEPGPWPTIVFASGFAIETAAYAPLLRQWQQAGFLVAAPASPGMAPSLGPASESELPNVPGDLSSVTTWLIQQGLANPQQLEAAGHSDGACAIAALALTKDHQDNRFRGYVVLAGDVVTLPDTYSAINNAPLFAAVGDSDEYGNASLTPAVFDDALAPKVLVTAQGGTHLGTFLPVPGALPTPVDQAILDFLEASDFKQAWSPLLALNNQLGITLSSTGM